MDFEGATLEAGAHAQHDLRAELGNDGLRFLENFSEREQRRCEVARLDGAFGDGLAVVDDAEVRVPLSHARLPPLKKPLRRLCLLFGGTGLQRIRKSNSSTDTVFHYDTRGKLIAESDPGGGFYKRELIYLGDIPVGVIQ